MIFRKNVNYSKITKYNREQLTKRENYKILNEEYALQNQTMLLGDSITDFFNYFELFYDYSKQNNTLVYNRGISGDTTDRLLERLNDNVLNINPKNSQQQLKNSQLLRLSNAKRTLNYYNYKLSTNFTQL